MSAQEHEWQPGDKAYIEVEVIERYNDTRFDVQISTGGASWLMSVAASQLRPVPAGGEVEAATEDVIENLRRLHERASAAPWLHLTERDGDEDGYYDEEVLTTQWSTPPAAEEDIWFEAGTGDDAALIVAMRNALPSLLAGGVPGRREAETEWAVEFNGRVIGATFDRAEAEKRSALVSPPADPYAALRSRNVTTWVPAARIAGTTEAGSEPLGEFYFDELPDTESGDDRG